MFNTEHGGMLVRVFIIIEAALLVLIEAFQLNAMGRLTNNVMYLSIVLCTAVTVYFYYRHGYNTRDEHAHLLVWGMVGTVLADFFLTFTNTAWAYTPGVALFCAVQLIYFLYLGSSKQALAARIACVAVGVAIVFAVRMAQLPALLGAADIALLLCNVIQAWRTKDRRVSALFKVGITLFLCCDLCVGAQFMVPPTLREMVSSAVWVFYLPAQVLITLAYVQATSFKPPVLRLVK